MLRISVVPPGDPTVDEYVGQNRFSCVSCPYNFVITKRYYERKYLKKKETEDVLGGKGAWDNVDKTEGAFRVFLDLPCDDFWRETWIQKVWQGILEREADVQIVQCPNEKCRNDEAYWYQLQIRSADEPMTAFYKVHLLVIAAQALRLTLDSAQDAAKNGENDRAFQQSHSRSFGAAFFKYTPVLFLSRLAIEVSLASQWFHLYSPSYYTASKEKCTCISTFRTRSRILDGFQNVAFPIHGALDAIDAPEVHKPVIVIPSSAVNKTCNVCSGKKRTRLK